MRVGQVDFVQALRDRVGTSPDRVAVHEGHKKLLDERLADADANPDDSMLWEEVREELAAKLRRAK
jgi:putative addiction module component (TIGR02574 family)